MNPIDRLVEYFAPQAALKRHAARQVLAYYEAARPSRKRKFYRDNAGPNRQTEQGAVPIRIQARHLEQNHDLTRGAIRTLVNNVVGPGGIGIEPQPRRADGSIHEEYANILLEAWRDWSRKPEVTHRHHFSKVQRIAARSWIRDGEMFAQILPGRVPFLDHGTRVPFSLELIEADMVPFEFTDEGRGIRQGVQLNQWGRAIGYWVYKSHPTDGLRFVSQRDLKFVPASRMLHPAFIDRIGQVRGVSEFASVITRLEDIKDYEESERVAAKIAAMLTAYVKRGNPDLYDPNALPRDEEGNPLPREINFQPGMVIDTLNMGEEIGLIDSKRPNPNVVTFRQGQLKAFAAGLGASYSSVSRDYDGTYSAQRQELVEQWVHYAVLTDDFVGDFIQPIWEEFVNVAALSVAPVPADVVPGTENDASYIGQSMPWIDPLKEAMGYLRLVRAGFASEAEVIRKRGRNPKDVLEQISDFRKRAKERDLTLDSDASVSSSTR
ncbi:phage portal protein, lambda family [Nitrosococcus halophilus Nc 4]|uniref:Phage portal protein, lambda family n=1 Tax=Nitrosococcus halophilus (strain Nc4) TaxID=472759 RepID=D5BYV6_NITHN|nr:phage portal protein [Nitrosococcus halophilus]ADE14169.1 phage portal protein, lambda family [Nitrosococcus halophilus Nc 4]